jgi:multidrug efflux pump
MVSQLEGSVLTAIALVMIVVLASLGTRSALLVGFAIPTSFLLTFALLAVMGITMSNIVMFGLILAVGMLVDGAIVVVEYADKRIRKAQGPDARLYRGRQAHVLAHRVVHRDHALRLPADAVLARCRGRVHGDAAGHADLRAVGLADRGADLPAGSGRRRGPMTRTFDRTSNALRALPWWARRRWCPWPSTASSGRDAGAEPRLSAGVAACRGGAPLPGAVLFVLGHPVLDRAGRRADPARPRRVEAGYRRRPSAGDLLDRGQPGDALVVIAS